jgi:hypothetical protein
MPFYVPYGCKKVVAGREHRLRVLEQKVLKEYLQTGNGNDWKVGGSCVTTELRICAV